MVSNMYNNIKQTKDQTGNRQNKKQLPNDYTIDEYITDLKQVLSEKRIAKIIQIFDNKKIEYIVLMD